MTKDHGKSAAADVEIKHKDNHRRLEIRLLRSHFNLMRTPKAMPNAGDPPSDPQSLAGSSQSSRTEDNTGASYGEGEGPSMGRSGGLAFGHVAMMGRRRVMEDTVTVAPPILLAEEYTFFAVYDGHGGAKVAEKCGNMMHKCLEKHVELARKSTEEEGFEWERVMVECFRSMDEELEQECSGCEASEREEKEAEEEKMMGSTATVVLVGKEEVVVANCGDSRAVLCRGGVVMPLSRDHKPDREDEKERIEAAGGKVINWNGWRVEGVLSTSRSLGDRYLKPYVCSEPEVTTVRRSESDDFMIIGTDGLFDVVCNEVACNVVKRCLGGKLRRRQAEGNLVSEAAAVLAELAIAKGSKDNISIIIVQMK